MNKQLVIEAIEKFGGEIAEGFRGVIVSTHENDTHGAGIFKATRNYELDIRALNKSIGEVWEWVCTREEFYAVKHGELKKKEIAEMTGGEADRIYCRCATKPEMESRVDISNLDRGLMFKVLAELPQWPDPIAQAIFGTCNPFYFAGDRILYLNGDSWEEVCTRDQYEAFKEYLFVGEIKADYFVMDDGQVIPRSPIERRPKSKEYTNSFGEIPTPKAAPFPNLNGFVELRGDEEWKPKVGDECTLENYQGRTIAYGEHLIGKAVRVESIFNNSSSSNLVAAVSFEGGCYCFLADMLHPIKSDEEKSVDAMYEICQNATDTYSACELLHKAGYKKCS